MGKHARLSPSNHRWPHCPGSVRMEADYPDIAGDAAVDGTGTHLLLELCLTEGRPAEHYLGTIIGANHEDKPSGWLVDAARIDRVNMALSYIKRRNDELKALYPDCVVIVEAESRSDPGGAFGRDDWYGTCDVTITAAVDERVIFVEVIDYKDGRGWVDVKDNPQLLGYLGGKLRPHIASGPELVRPFACDKVYNCRMTIVQPRTSPPVRYEDMFPSEAMKKVEALAWAAHQTDRVDAPLVPGSHCQWCKHKPNCSEQSKQDLEKVKTMTTDVAIQDRKLFEVIESTFGDVTLLDNQSLAQLADAEAGIQAVFDKVKEEIRRRLETGDQVPGYALKPGRGSNVWAVDEEQIVKVLKARKWTKDMIYPPKLVSPAQVLKSDALTADQKAKIEKDYIVFKAGDLKLTKVAVQKKTSNDVAELFQDVVQLSKPVEELSFL